MRVTMLTSFPPMRCGIGDHTAEFAPYLARAGVDLDLLTYRIAGGATEETTPSGRVHRRLTYSSPPWVVARELDAIGRDAPLVVQSQSFLHPRPTNLLPWFRRARGPLVLSVHDAPRTSRLFHASVFLRRLYRAADAIVVYSDVTAAALTERHRVPSELVHRLPLGVDLAAFSPSARQPRVRATHGWAPDDIVVLFLGFINEGKGVRELLTGFAAAAQRQPRLRLVFAGDDASAGRAAGATGLVAQLKLQARALGVESRVSFLGYVASDDVPGLLASADVVTLPYDFSYQSAVLANAMGAGACILASSIDGFTPWVTHEESALLVPPRDANTLAAALLRLARDEDLRERLRKGANARAQKEQDMAIVARDFRRVVDEA